MTALRQDDAAPRGFVPKADYYKALSEIDRLKDEVEGLKAELGLVAGASRINAARLFLRSGGSGPYNRYASAQMARLLLGLVDSGLVTHENFASLVCSDGECGKLPAVLVCHLRGQLKALGCPEGAVGNLYKIGYTMSAEGRAWARGKMPEAFGGKL